METVSSSHGSGDIPYRPEGVAGSRSMRRYRLSLLFVVTAVLTLPVTAFLLNYGVGDAAMFAESNPAWTMVATLGGIFLILLGFIFVADVTIQRANRRELALAQNQLEERLQVTEELQRARDSALEASRTKSDFLASMSHEIRTPLNAIIGMAELLSETSMNSEQQEYVRITRTAGDALLALINDILDLSKVEAGQLHLEKADFDLADLVENTCEFYSMRAHTSGLEMNCHVSPEVPTALSGDPTRVRQVLTNLLGNAIKFTKQGEVSLYVGNDPTVNEPGYLLFRVTDTGIGIPPDKLDTIFDSFAQADSSTTREHGGTGLGLAICRRLVEMMQGQIWVESEVGVGSSFYFTAQFAIQAEPHKSMALPGDDLPSIKVMIVDDNSTNRVILKETISAWGVPATEVADGQQALVLLDSARKAQEPYDLLLLDDLMPGMDGIQVAEHIRKELGISDMQIVMLTSGSRFDNTATRQELNICRYLVKPVKRSDLFHAIFTDTGFMKPTREDPGPSEGSASLEDQRPLSILLVEDSRDNRLLVEAYLNKTPHGISIAENGEIAVTKFMSESYDLVLMDVQMPVMDGHAATRAIRRWEAEQGKERTPIIALTAHALKEDVQKSFDAGCTAHITKPVKKGPLLETIHEHTRSVPV